VYDGRNRKSLPWPGAGHAQAPRTHPAPGEPADTDLRDRLARGGDLTPAQVAQLLLADQMARWGRGERIPAEAYLQLHPALTAANPEAFDLVFNEFLLREDGGEMPAPAEYLWRFTQFSERFQRQLEVHQGLRSGQPSAPSALADEPGPTADPGPPQDPSGRPGPRPAVAGYDILEELGRGGMGVVYKAVQKSLKRLVALKLVLGGAHADEHVADRLRREAEAAARLQHPNIVHIFEVGEQDGLPYLSLEFIEGNSLARQLGGGPLPPRQAAQLIEVLARAMHYAHGAGIVHRDLKPANVLLAHGRGQAAEGNENGGGGASSPAPVPWTQACTPKITDFGLAKWVGRGVNETQTGAIVGTASYMAPEQAAGQARDVGPAADIYALGSILYETLTGRPPFRADNVLDTLEQVRGQDPVPPSQLQPKCPRDLETICLKCLQKAPSRRYASAAELADDLLRFQAGEPIRARSVAVWERGWKWARCRPAWATLIGVGALALLASAVGGWKYTADLRDALGQKDDALQQKGVEQARAHKNLQQAHEAIARMVKRVEVKSGSEIEVPEIREAREALLADMQDLCEGLTGDEGETDPETRYYHAYAFLALAGLQVRQRRFMEAEKNYEIGLPRLQRLAEQFPNVPKYRHELADSRGGLGLMYYLQGRPDQAKQALREAADDWESVTAVYPAGRGNLAEVYIDLGNADLGLAEEYYGKAIAIRQDLLREQPDDPGAKHALAVPYYNRGKHHHEHGRQNEALADFRQAAQLLEGLPRDRRGYREYLGSLVAVYQGLGTAFPEGSPERGAYYEKAVGLAAEMDRLFPDVFWAQDWLASSRYLLAIHYWPLLDRSKEAEDLLGKVVAFYESQPRDISQGPYPWFRLSEALDLLGMVQERTTSPRKAEATLRKAIDVAQNALRMYPDNLTCLYTLADHCCDLASVCRRQGHNEEALKWCELGLTPLEKVRTKDPTNAAPRAVMYSIHDNRARCLAKLGRREAALAALDRAKGCCADASGVGFQSLFLEVLSELGEHTRARDAAKSLAAMPRLAPGDRDAVYDLATICAQKMQALPAFGACTVVGLMASPHSLGPLLAAPALIPGRGAEKGQSVPDLYEDAALALLERLRSDGYFRDPTLTALGASTLGLLGAPHGHGPLLAVSALFPGRPRDPARGKLLEDDAKLAPLRSRPAFKAFLRDKDVKRAGE
jgi:serine/threonine protein kinase